MTNGLRINPARVNKSTKKRNAFKYMFCCSESFIYLFHFHKLLAACCQRYELGERFDTVEKAGVVEVGEDMRETRGGIG